MTDATAAPTTIVWFRQDLRLSDNPALAAALGAGGPVLPLYVLDDEAPGEWRYGGASRWWLHHSLAALAADLAARGAPLLVLRGPADRLVPEVAARSGAASVQAGRMYEPWARERDARAAEALSRDGRRLALHTSTVLREPSSVLTGAGKPYGVYTPYARNLMASDPPTPLPDPPERVPGARHPVESLALDALDLLPKPPTPDWAAEFGTVWTPGEAGGRERLRRFVAKALGEYGARRNDPALEGSSGLSPHLRWGEVSPRQVWHACLDALGDDRARAEPFLKEIVWRDFSYNLLWHRPEITGRPLRPAYERFPYAPDDALLRAWKAARTGYPIVDAGMRQLWRIGWMHNRVRLVASSLLVKHLLQPWQAGTRVFWDRLVDADLASNSASWQWIAGAGTDAAPYFRVFNPVAQGEKFDPEGAYVRRWLPRLAKLPTAYIHRPWEAPDAALRAAGVRLGVDYPRPVVTHEAGRARALAALAAIRAPGEAAPGEPAPGDAAPAEAEEPAAA